MGGIMKGKLIVIGIVMLLIIAPFIIALPAKPNKTNDRSKPGTDFNGEHYTLNILGKKKIGNGSYDNPDRHTIFVPLEGDTRILMHLGSDFGVLDGNGLDGECIFQMPRKQKNFRVYVVALGKPMDGSKVECADHWIFDNETNTWYYELLDSFDIEAHKGKPKWINVTSAFMLNLSFFNQTSGETGILYLGWLWQVPEEIWEQSYYFWDLKGSDRHIQVRFYPY
jgi:hypothetical protein